MTDLLFSPSVKKQEMVTESLIIYISQDMLPFASADVIRFLEFMRTVSLDYEIPCQNTTKRRMLGLNLIKNELLVI